MSAGPAAALRARLAALMGAQGPGAPGDARRCAAVLMAEAGPGSRRELGALLAALGEGAADAPGGAGPAVGAVAGRLVARHGVAPGLALWAAESWSLALGWPGAAAGGARLVQPPAGPAVELAHVPAGAFVMGSDSGMADEAPARVVELDGFWMGRTPVTVAQYRAFCEATGRAMPDAPRWGWVEDHPVVNAGWEDASAWCAWAGLTLPTEAQWEKAARGTDGRAFPWGDDWSAGRAVCSAPPTEWRSTAPAGSLAEGSSPWGCLDMAGNVWEWCADLYAAEGPHRALRGGAWFFYEATAFRCSYRAYNNLGSDSLDVLGFRAALVAV